MKPSAQYPTPFIDRRGTFRLLGGVLVVGATLPTTAKANFTGGFCGQYGGAGGGWDEWDDHDWGDITPNPEYDGSAVWLFNNQTGETYNRPHGSASGYDPGAHEEFNHFARDGRSPGQPSRDMDPRLLDIMWALGKAVNKQGPFRINSAYRTASRNATLAGAATNSLHVRGQALDVHNGEQGSGLSAAARRLAMGGVGQYSTFTHVDTGGVRTWGNR